MPTMASLSGFFVPCRHDSTPYLVQHAARFAQQEEPAAEEQEDRGMSDAAVDPGLPPDLPAWLLEPPPGDTDPALQAKVARWIQLRQMGKSVADELRKYKDYR